MSIVDLLHSGAHPSVSALRVAEYANSIVHERERAQIFRPGLGLLYLDHRSLWASDGVRRSDGDPRILIGHEGESSCALANLCTHALRPLIDDDVVIDRTLLTCPYHQWSYRRDGSFVGGPGCEFGSGRAGERERQALDLRRYETIDWNGFTFAVDPARREEFAADLSDLDRSLGDHGLDCDFGVEWELRETVDEEFAADWKIFMEVFGDCYHVPPFHDGLAAFADCDTLEWRFGEHFHVQYLDFAVEAGGASDHYRAWAEGLATDADARGRPMQSLAVAWIAIYPNLMIELYAGLRVISIVIPTGPNSFVNRAHFFTRVDGDSHVAGLTDSVIAAYHETAVQDFELVETRARGLATAKTLALDNAGYLVQTSGRGVEAGVAHFHDWWRAAMA